MIVEVAQQSWLISDLTGSHDGSRRGCGEDRHAAGKAVAPDRASLQELRVPHTCGGTALWHGLYYTAMALKRVTGRKAIVVLSDGMDTGSDISLTDLIEAAQSAEAVVYSIKYESPVRFISIMATVAQAMSHGLERLDRETGGLTFPNPGTENLRSFLADRNRSAQYVRAGIHASRRGARRQVSQARSENGAGRPGGPLPRRLLGAEQTVDQLTRLELATSTERR